MLVPDSLMAVQMSAYRPRRSSPPTASRTTNVSPSDSCQSISTRRSASADRTSRLGQSLRWIEMPRPCVTRSESTRLNSSHSQISYAVFCLDRKSTRLNSSHSQISYAVFCLDQKSTRLNSSHSQISYAVFCLERKNTRLNSGHIQISYARFCLKKKNKAYRELRIRYNVDPACTYSRHLNEIHTWFVQGC